jgi:Protein of unknown function (DUF4011)
MSTNETSKNTPDAPDNLSRKKLVESAREGWINRLIDLSRRNNLLFYKPVVSGTLELPVGDPLMSFLTSGELVNISELIGADQTGLSHIRSIARKGLENLEEKGLSTLYIAIGKATWTADDGGRDPVAPVILAPVTLKLKGQDLLATEVQLSGELEINPVLLHVLNKELNISITAETLLKLLSIPENGVANGLDSDQTAAVLPTDDVEGGKECAETETSVNVAAVFDHLNAQGKRVPGFRADSFAVIGNFFVSKDGNGEGSRESVG